MNRVAVLMSTYNGEKFLQEQIESILSQKDVELTLYIRDDGSLDRTIDIIDDYNKKHPNICFTKGNNVGVGNSFMQLVYKAPTDYDYYAFADQDDIWLSEKLSKAISILKKKNTPYLYCSNQSLVDKELNSLGKRYKQTPDTSYMQILCNNKITGCTMVWNNALNTLIRDENRRPDSALLRNRIHDVWVAMVASVVGEIYFDMDSYIKYRQHDNNVVGARKKTLYNDITEKIGKLFNPNERNGRSLLAKAIYRLYGEYIAEQEVLIDSAYYNKIALVKDVSIIARYSGETYFGLILKVLLGLY